MNYFINILISITIIVFIYFKPLYFFITLIIFMPENLFFISLTLELIHNFKDYYKINIKEVDVSECSTLKIWIEYEKIQGFKKLYRILSKKGRLNFISIITTICTIILGFPIRTYRLLEECHRHKKYKFRKIIIIIYSFEYEKYKNCAIECLNGEIYINCYTIGKLLNQSNFRNNRSKLDVFDTILELKKLNNSFVDYEKKNAQVEEMKLISGYNKSGDEIFSFHYGIEKNKNTLHGTSNVPNKLLLSQKFHEPIPELIKVGSRNPGTIFSEDVEKIVYGKKEKIVSSYSLAFIKKEYNSIWNLDSTTLAYMHNKTLMYESLFIGSGYEMKLIKELRMNLYSIALENSTNNSIMKEIDNYFF